MFWKRYKELGDWQKIIERIEKGEQKIQRRVAIERALALKVARHKNPYQTLTIPYGPSTGKAKAFTEEEDRFLVCMMAQVGYGNWDVIKMEIRRAWQFRFDWFMRTRTSAELQRRCDTLIRLIEKENEEMERRKRHGKGGADRKRARPDMAADEATPKAKRKA